MSKRSVTPTRISCTRGSIGYWLDMLGLTCAIDVVRERNCNRGENNISGYYAEPSHRRWLTQAANATQGEGEV